MADTPLLFYDGWQLTPAIFFHWRSELGRVQSAAYQNIIISKSVCCRHENTWASNLIEFEHQRQWVWAPKSMSLAGKVNGFRQLRNIKGSYVWNQQRKKQKTRKWVCDIKEPKNVNVLTKRTKWNELHPLFKSFMKSERLQRCFSFLLIERDVLPYNVFCGSIFCFFRVFRCLKWDVTMLLYW